MSNTSTQRIPMDYSCSDDGYFHELEDGECAYCHWKFDENGDLKLD